MSLSRRQSFERLAAAAAVPWMARAANPAPHIRLIVLDVGGTIIEDRGDVPEMLRSALHHHGISSTPQEIAQWRGASKRAMVQHFVDQQEPAPKGDRGQLADAIYTDFTRDLIAAYQSVPPIAGAEDAIREMRQAGFLVATSTGFDAPVCKSILQRLSWERYFVASVTSDDVSEGRPAPYMLFRAMEAARVHSVAEVMAVGDTPLDLQAGANGGMRAVVGVLSGASTLEKLRAEPHTHILPSVARLPELLRSHR